MDEDEEDEEADAAAAEANPYYGILLHGMSTSLHDYAFTDTVESLELLGPLTSAADLPVHPSLSVPFTSSILSNMLQDACETVRRERNTIRVAKQLLTKLRGDETWIPGSALGADIDDVIFDTTKVYEEIVRLRPSSTMTKRKNGDQGPLAPAVNHAVKDPLADQTGQTLEGAGSAEAPLQQVENTDMKEISGPGSLPDTVNGIEESRNGSNGPDAGNKVDNTATRDFEAHGATISNVVIDPKAGGTDSNVLAADGNRPNPEKMELGGRSADNGSSDAHTTNTEQPSTGNTINEKDDEAQGVSLPPSVLGKEDISMLQREPSVANDDLQPTAHRMRTRAQAQAVSDNATSMRTRSPSITSSIVPSIHPLFLTPGGACQDRDFGLPPEEAEATRRILMSYVQKQEEVCRGAEKLHNGLLKAERMKKDVFDSCKAEGHIGEMSDGEDWYDKKEWGLEEDLRKGHDEEEDDTGIQHKKTRGRRA